MDNWNLKSNVVVYGNCFTCQYDLILNLTTNDTYWKSKLIYEYSFRISFRKEINNSGWGGGSYKKHLIRKLTKDKWSFTKLVNSPQMLGLLMGNIGSCIRYTHYTISIHSLLRTRVLNTGLLKVSPRVRFIKHESTFIDFSLWYIPFM